MKLLQKNTTSSMNKEADASGDDFFIPDLCKARSVLVLVFSSEMFALIVAVVANPLPDFDWTSLGLVSLLVQWVTLSSAAIVCALRPFLRQIPQSLALAFCLIIILIDTTVFSLFGQWFFTPSFLGYSAWQHLDYWLVAQNLLISTLISGMLFRYFVVHQNLRAKESAELTARLQSLQSRIRPHFLFNSMNIIASLIAVDPDKAETVVEDLSELFRASLKETANIVPLSHEIELCKKYAGIEQLRLGPRLEVNWFEQGFEENTFEEVKILMLLLQPLLENAIYHGVQPRPEGGVIDIVLDNKLDFFEVTMTNPLPAATFHSSSTQGQGTQHKGNKMALDNIRHRLETIYGGAASLTQDQVADKFVTVLSFPKINLIDGEDQGR